MRNIFDVFIRYTIQIRCKCLQYFDYTQIYSCTAAGAMVRKQPPWGCTWNNIPQVQKTARFVLYTYCCFA